MLRLTWSDFLERFLGVWDQGEHVFIYGENGSGKTDIAFRLLNTRDYGVAIITKPHDPIFKSALTRGYRRVHAWPPREVSPRDSHFLLSAKINPVMTKYVETQRELFPQAIDDIYADGGWTISFDETLQLSQVLGMGPSLRYFSYLSRSNGLTGIYCTQRPKNIPPVILQSCVYSFLARSRRNDDLNTLTELGPDKAELREYMRALRGRHEFVFLDSLGRIPLCIVNSHR